MAPSSTKNRPVPSEAARPRERRELADLPLERLEAEVHGLSARMAAGTYELLVVAGELDDRRSWALWGALSCAAWLADACDIEISTARNQVRVAKAMRTYPKLDAAMAAGEISYARARVLVASLDEDNADALIDLARQHPAGRLGAEIARWSQRNEDPDTISTRQKEVRQTSWRTDPDGTQVITTRLPPESGGAVCAAIDGKVIATRAPAGASLGQQRADAFVELMTGGGAGIQAELVIHVTEDGNHLPDGTPLSDHAVTELLPGAFISLLLHDNERYPIDASPRRRHPTRRQRRVLEARQDECQHPGCHARVFLQADHIEPYDDNGPTTIDNLRRLCGPHNRARQAAPVAVE